MSTTIDSSWLKPTNISDLKEQQIKDKIQNLNTKGPKTWTYQEFITVFKLHLEIMRRLDILNLD